MSTVDIDAIDAILPQTQCGECGYAGCRPYATALATGLAPIDRCPPGGLTTLKALGELLAIDPSPYFAGVQAKTRHPALALIEEDACIGCTKCIQACPVDAIIGTAKRMHSILPTDCTGCGLCIEPCPVNCIELIPLPAEIYNRAEARERYEAKQIRHTEDQRLKQQLYQQKRQLKPSSKNMTQERQAKQQYIQQALQRVTEKKSHAPLPSRPISGKDHG